MTFYKQHYVFLANGGVNSTVELIQIIENRLFQNVGTYTQSL